MRIPKVIFVIALITGLLTALFYYGVYTTRGSRWLAHKIIDSVIEHRDLAPGDAEGNLGEGMTIKDLEIQDIKGLPEGSMLRIQRIYFNFRALNIDGLEAEVENARLLMPDSDPLVLWGSLTGRLIEMNVHSVGFSIREVLSYLPDFKTLIPLVGDVKDIDIYVKGPYDQPDVTGKFTIRDFTYKGFRLNGGSWAIDLKLKDVERDVKIFGSVQMASGTLETKRVLVNLSEAALFFSGPWDDPRVNVSANAKVEKTNISIKLTGTKSQPDLQLTSEPPYSKERLMIMLATGKSWQSIDRSLDSGVDSAALTRDFLDYWLFAGKSNQFAQKFGISEFTVQYNDSAKGVAAKKEITDKIGVGYGIEQTVTTEQKKNTTQTIGGEVKLNDKLSVGVERELTTSQTNEAENPTLQEKDEKVMLKYKKSF